MRSWYPRNTDRQIEDARASGQWFPIDSVVALDSLKSLICC